MSRSPSDSAFERARAAGSSAILADIDETRARMDVTIDELTDRLRPRHLLDDLIEVVRSRVQRRSQLTSKSQAAADAQVSRADGLSAAGLNAWAVVRDQPLPAAIIAAGVLLMIVQGRRHRPAETTKPDRGHARIPFTHREQSMKDKGRNIGDSDHGRSEPFGERLRESMSPDIDFGEESHGVGERMRERASEFGDRIQHGYVHAKDAIGRFIEERPLAIAAGALAAGLIVGLLIPRTFREERFLGSLSRDVKKRGREMGREVIERGGRVAETTIDAFAEEARRQGLTPEALLDQVRRVGSTPAGP